MKLLSLLRQRRDARRTDSTTRYWTLVRDVASSGDRLTEKALASRAEELDALMAELGLEPEHLEEHVAMTRELAALGDPAARLADLVAANEEHHRKVAQLEADRVRWLEGHGLRVQAQEVHGIEILNGLQAANQEMDRVRALRQALQQRGCPGDLLPATAEEPAEVSA